MRPGSYRANSLRTPSGRMNRRELLSQDAYLRRIAARNQRERTAILIVWGVLVCCVVTGTLLPNASPLIQAVRSLHIHGRVIHFCMYLSVSFPPVIGMRERRKGLLWGLSIILLGAALEFGQHFSPGRTPAFGDGVANGFGVIAGILLGRPVRNRLAIY